MSDPEAIAKSLSGLAKYYRQEIPDIVLGVMARNLAKHEPQAVRDAINKHIENPDRGRFFPLLADLMVYLGGTDAERGRIAWDEAFGAIRKHGSYTGITFADPLITHTIAGMGGWPRFCQMGLDELPFRQKEFVDRYATSTRLTPENVPEYLPGLNTDGAIAYVGTPPPNALPKPAQRSDTAALAYIADRIKQEPRR